MTAKKVAVVMGSDSDIDAASKAIDILTGFGLPYVVAVMSAHRSPDRVREFAMSAHEDDVAVIIAIAGGAAHLAGVISSLTSLPVIGVPMTTGVAGGLDSLLSTVQMPAGVPVLTVGMGGAGAANAAIAAARILALSDTKLAKTLEEYRKSLAEAVDEKDTAAQAKLGKHKQGES